MNNLQNIRRPAALLALAVTFALASTARAQSARSIQSFDNDWRFNKGDVPASETNAFNDSAWRQLNVPHDWAIEGPFEAGAPTRGSGGFAPSGVVWYRKSFPTPQGADKRVFINFDGVMEKSDVYVNGQHLGKRPFGYIGFQYDMTGKLKTDGTPNILAVRADTSQQPASRWYTGGGIYRHVRLEVKDPIHIENWGTFVTTPKVDAQVATVHVRSTVVNTSNAPKEISVQFDILGPDGKSVAKGSVPAKTIEPGKSADFESDITVNNPKLWDIDDTQRHTAVASVRSGTTTLDDESVPFGIRSAEFKAESGFWLNGKNIKLKGVCLHHDAGALGAAVPEDAWIHRLQTLKQFGANAVRTAHNPQSQAFLDACDKVGVLVMDENFDCWEIGKNRFDYSQAFREWNLIDTRDMVRRDRNHPSIILYSMGNEIREPNSNVARAKEILGALIKVTHENDPTRPVTQALFRPNGDPPAPGTPRSAFSNGLADMLDVIGTNYRDEELVTAWKDKPTRKIVGTENNLPNSAWAWVRDNPSYSGSFIWTGSDYLGETFSYPSIGASFGYLDIADRPKTSAYERASWWSTTPVVYIARATPGGAGRGAAPGGAAPGGEPGAGGEPAADAMDILANDATILIAAPAAPGAAPGGAAPAAGARGAGARGAGARGGAAPGGAAAPGGRGGRGGPTLDWSPINREAHTEAVSVYSNCEEVELFLNDKSLGTKPRGAIDSIRTWQVEFASGTLKAVGKNKGQAVANHELKTAGPATKLTADASTKKLFADFDSLAYVAVNITDAAGTLVPTASNNVSFKITGPGEIAALTHGQAISQSFRGTEHDAANGKVIAYIRATGNSGAISVTASADGLQPVTFTFETAPARPVR